MVILFMLPGGGPNVDDNVRSGQAQHDSTAKVVAVLPKNSNNNYADNTDDNNNDAADLDSEIEIAREDIEEAERKELEKNKSSLTAAIEVTGSYVRSAFSKLLGNTDITQAEIEQMVEEVETKLEEATIGQLEEDANEIAATLEDDIEGEAYDESDSGLTVDEIRSDIMENEEAAIREMNRQIDEKAEKMKQMMRQKAQEFEIEILEKRLEEKFHKKVKLVIIDEDLADVDHILDGLSTLNGDSDTGSYQGAGSSHGSVSPPGSSSSSADAGSNSNDDDDDDDDNNTGTNDDDDANWDMHIQRI